MNASQQSSLPPPPDPPALPDSSALSAPTSSPSSQKSHSSHPSHAFRSRRLWLLGAGGALVWLALAVAFAGRVGFIIDEGQHLGAGLALLRAGDGRMNLEHPPLVKALAAMPVMLLSPPDFQPASPSIAATLDFAWRRSDPWIFIYSLYFLPNDVPWPHRLLLARLGPIALGLLGGVLAFLWGRALSRRSEGGLLAAGLLLFYPEYMGHACFVTFDVPLLVSGGAISWMAWRWWRRPDWRRGAALALVSAVAVQVKLPATFFLGFTVAVLFALSFASGGRVRPWRVAALGAGVLAIWWAGAWAAAGFRFAALNPAVPLEGGVRFLPPVPGDDHGPLLRLCNFLWEHRLLPEAAIAQWIHLSSFERRIYFLLGDYRNSGWLHYFLVTFVLKTPLPLMAGVPILAWRGWRLVRRPANRTRAWRLQRAAILGVPFALLLLIVMVSRINLGHRYILFIYFPLCVGLGAELVRWWRKSAARGAIPWRRLAVAVMAAGQAASFLFAWPHLSTYFNLIGGSPYRASRWVGDSNTDWGQDDAGILVRLTTLGWVEANLCLFDTNYPPEIYGLANYRWFHPLNLPPFTHGRWDEWDSSLPTIISVNELQSVRETFPGRFDRDPDLLWNSQAVYLPDRARPQNQSGHDK